MADTSTASAFDLARLARWMDGEDLAGAGEVPRLSRLVGGSQNELYVVTPSGAPQHHADPAAGRGREAA